MAFEITAYVPSPNVLQYLIWVMLTSAAHQMQLCVLPLTISLSIIQSSRYHFSCSNYQIPLSFTKKSPCRT